MKLDKSNERYIQDLDFILSLPGIDALKGKSVLVTGSTGMVGVSLVDALMRYNLSGAGIKVIAVGRDKDKAAARLGEYYDNPLFSFLEQDVRSPFPDNLPADYIIPLASNTHPVAYSKFPVETVEINVLGAKYALELAWKCGATVLYPSSVEIYGNGDDEFDESYTGKLNLATSRSCYTESKRLAEALCQSYIAEHGVDCKIVRLSRLFGPTMLESDTKASSQFIQKAIAGEDIVLKSKGEQLFSYTYVPDAVRAMLFVLINGECGQAYNVASEQCNVRLSDFAAVCAEAAGTSVVFDLPSEIEMKGYSIAQKAIMSTERLKALGWRAHYQFKDAIYRTIAILREYNN